MEAATHLGLPWRLLRDKLAPIQPDTAQTDVHYKLTLQMLDTDLIVSAMRIIPISNLNRKNLNKKPNFLFFPLCSDGN